MASAHCRLVRPSRVPRRRQPERRFDSWDVNGTPVVIRTTDYPETSPFETQQGVAQDATRHKADQVELHRMLDSIEFGRKPDLP